MKKMEKMKKFTPQKEKSKLAHPPHARRAETVAIRTQETTIEVSVSHRGVQSSRYSDRKSDSSRSIETALNYFLKSKRAS